VDENAMRGELWRALVDGWLRKQQRAVATIQGQVSDCNHAAQQYTGSCRSVVSSATCSLSSAFTALLGVVLRQPRLLLHASRLQPDRISRRRLEL